MGAGRGRPWAERPRVPPRRQALPPPLAVHREPSPVSPGSTPPLRPSVSRGDHARPRPRATGASNPPPLHTHPQHPRTPWVQPHAHLPPPGHPAVPLRPLLQHPRGGGAAPAWETLHPGTQSRAFPPPPCLDADPRGGLSPPRGPLTPVGVMWTKGRCPHHCGATPAQHRLAFSRAPGSHAPVCSRFPFVLSFTEAMLRLRLLTWDVKDTLLRLRQPVGESYAAEARAHGVRVQPEALSRSFQEAYGAQSRRFPNYGRGQGLTSRQWWVDVVKQTFRLSGVHEDGVLTLIAEKLYRDFCSTHNWEVLPGAGETLSHCCQRGFRMGVISNFDNRLENVLSQCNLRHHFEFVLTSEDVGFAKPDRRIFEKALHLSGVLPEQAAHVGDSYTRDYRAARAVGMHSFLLRAAGQGEEPEVPPEHLLPTLSHLLALIEKG